MAPSWIITLHAGAAPSRAPEPRGPMARYDFFTSRTLEDGRERFRLHLGYFDDLPTAKTILRVARETYPAAWLVPAQRYRLLRRVPSPEPVPGTGTWTGTGLAPSGAAGPPAEAGAELDAAAVLALLGGAATLLAGVLPDVVADGAGTVRDAVEAVPSAGPASACTLRAADALVRDVSRFIVEEWQPEARRPQRLPAEQTWFTRWRRGKRAERQSAAS